MNFGGGFGPWTLKNERLVYARCYVSEMHHFQARIGFGLISIACGNIPAPGQGKLGV